MAKTHPYGSKEKEISKRDGTKNDNATRASVGQQQATKHTSANGGNGSKQG